MACQQDVTMAICIHLHSKDVCWALSSKSTFGFTFLFTQQRKKEKDRLHQKPKPHIQRHEGMKGYNINHFDGKSVKQKSSLGLLCDASPILCDECQAPCFSIHSGCSQFLVFGSAFDAIIIWVNGVKLCHIQALINAAGDRLNFSNQLILNVLQVVAVI